MTQGVIIQRLTAELLLQLTGDIINDEPIVRQYIMMALDIGVNHFSPDMEEVAALTMDGRLINRYKGVTEAARKTGVPQSYISSVLIGDQHSTRGMLFRKVDPLESLSYCEISKVG